MSYEYKEEILSDIGPEPNCNYESESNRYYDKIDELDHVYAQAAKADEYEAKAKAFEKVAGIAYWYFERVNPEYADFSDYEGFYDDIKDVFKKLESGDSDA